MKTKEERIKEIKEAYQKKFADIDERRQYRMKNYYDGVDDYSFGGLCDKADNELEDKLRTERDILIEQVENDDKVIRTSFFHRLVSNTGEVCDGARYGQYGAYFTIDGRFVGVPKKLCTLTKKGYKLYKVKRTYECTLKEVCKYGARWRRMKLVNETMTEENEIPDSVGELHYIDYQYNEYFNHKED